MSRASTSIPIPGDPSGNGPIARNIRTTLAAVRTLARIRGTNGVKVNVSRDGVTIGLSTSEVVLLGRIAAVIVGGTRFEAFGEQPDKGLPSTVLYDVRIMARPDVGEAEGEPGTLRNLTPDLGRPVKDDEVSIWPCKVGDLVRFVRGVDVEGVPKSYFEVTTERIAFAACGGAP